MYKNYYFVYKYQIKFKKIDPHSNYASGVINVKIFHVDKNAIYD